MARAFLDTNILVYADDVDAGPKRAKAQALVLDALANGDAVIHAARRAGCDRLMTEDLQAGQRIEGVKIVNPFA